MLWEGKIDPSVPHAGFDGLRDAWARPENRVFVMRGSPDIGDIQTFYTAHFPDIGTPLALAEDATVADRDQQRTGDVWMEVRYDPTIPDAYRHSANAQPLHTDGSYIPSFPNATLMTCIANAESGGETTFIDGGDVVAALQAEQPDLLRYLSGKSIRHARSGDARTERVIDLSGPLPLVNWNYYCLDKALGPEDRAAAEAFFAFLQTSPAIADKMLAVKLEPGDAITWKDREVLHGRNGFHATRESERFLWKCAIDVGQFADA